MLIANDDHWFLNHLYIHPEYQGKGAGSQIIGGIKGISLSTRLPIHLAALKQSELNKFYKKHGFSLTHREQWDNYYEYLPPDC